MRHDVLGELLGARGSGSWRFLKVPGFNGSGVGAREEPRVEFRTPGLCCEKAGEDAISKGQAVAYLGLNADFVGLNLDSLGVSVNDLRGKLCTLDQIQRPQKSEI